MPATPQRTPPSTLDRRRGIHLTLELQLRGREGNFRLKPVRPMYLFGLDPGNRRLRPVRPFPPPPVECGSQAAPYRTFSVELHFP